MRIKSSFLPTLAFIICFSTLQFSCKKSNSSSEDTTPHSITIISPIAAQNVDIYEIPIKVTTTDNINLNVLTVLVEATRLGSSSLQEITQINQKTFTYTDTKTFPLILSSPETFKLTATATDLNGNVTTKSVIFTAQ